MSAQDVRSKALNSRFHAKNFHHDEGAHDAGKGKGGKSKTRPKSVANIRDPRWPQEFQLVHTIFISGVGGVIGCGGFIVLVLALTDLIILSNAWQGECTLFAFEYPLGFPDEQTIVDGMPQTNPCPQEPQCLFNVRANVFGRGAVSVRDFDYPFNVPTHSSSGGGLRMVNPYEQLDCCPLTPADCCTFFDIEVQQFCDQNPRAGCHIAPWQCFFTKLVPPAGQDNAMEVDGAFMQIGRKLRSLPDMFIGLGITLLGLLILSLNFARVRKAIVRCGRHSIRRSVQTYYTVALKIAEKTPRSIQTQGMLDMIAEKEMASMLQRAVRRWLDRVRRKREGNETAAEQSMRNKERKRQHKEAKKKAQEAEGIHRSETTGESSVETVSPEEIRQRVEDQRIMKYKEERRNNEQSLFRLGETGRISKHPPEKSRNRKLLLDSGSLTTFKRLTRVRVTSEPFTRLRLEVAIEAEGPRFGAFVHVRTSMGAKIEGVPPVVSRVLPASLAEMHGIKPGFQMLKVGRLEWPNWPAERMVQELESGQRPTFIVLEEPAPLAAPAVWRAPPEEAPPPLFMPEEEIMPPSPEIEDAPLPPGEPPPRPHLSGMQRTRTQSSCGSLHLPEAPEALDFESNMLSNLGNSSVDQRMASEPRAPDRLKRWKERPSTAGAADVSTYRLADQARMEANQKRPHSASGKIASWKDRFSRPSSASSLTGMLHRGSSALRPGSSSGGNAGRRTRPFSGSRSGEEAGRPGSGQSHGHGRPPKLRRSSTPGGLTSGGRLPERPERPTSAASEGKQKKPDESRMVHHISSGLDNLLGFGDH
eukprot:TRINITY_DN2377_c0_g1_i1.p1 TRINITY_DN2377_c0_g1~~TRINITY_DN2377_c0_g1_i1.p1  ORF type:complete len:814 (+),score=130.00 TRINITY_DN2377_c0_g1_i1:279-2720(+)